VGSDAFCPPGPRR